MTLKAVARVLADVVRLEKGHTEGFELSVTEHLVELIVINEEQLDQKQFQ